MLYTDETGHPTHLRDDFFGEMTALTFTEGVAVLARSGGARTITVWEDQPCIALEYDDFSSSRPFSDSIDVLNGDTEACPTGAQVPLRIDASGSELPSVLLPGSGVEIVSSYPLDPSEDRFELSIDGEVREATRAVDAPDTWTLTPVGLVPFGADVELAYVGSRARAVRMTDLRTLDATTAVVSDLSLSTPMPEGAQVQVQTTGLGGRTCGLLAMGAPPEGSVELVVDYVDQWGAPPTDWRLVNASGDVLDRIEGPEGAAVLSVPADLSAVWVLYVTGPVSAPFDDSAPLRLDSLEWR
ncbi:MAG: hypothetical protein AB8I08_18990 [Sandaracinaceae bacterium]